MIECTIWSRPVGAELRGLVRAIAWAISRSRSRSRSGAAVGPLVLLDARVKRDPPGQQVAELGVDVVDQAAVERQRVRSPARPS